MKNKNPNRSKLRSIFNPPTGKLLSHQGVEVLHPVRGNKSGVVLLFLLVIFLPLLLNIAQAQEVSVPTVPGVDPEILNKQPEEILENYKNYTETKWEYIGKEWQAMLLKNPGVAAVDSFLKKIDIVFVILFGRHYAISITLLIVIFLWIWFFLEFNKMLENFSMFSGGVSLGIAAALTIIFAQFQGLVKITEFFGWLIFSNKSLAWNIIITAIIVLTMVVIYGLTVMLQKKSVGRKKKKEEEQARVDREIIHRTAQAATEED